MWPVTYFPASFYVNWASLCYASGLLWRLSISATVLWVGLMVSLNAAEMWRIRNGSTSSLSTLLSLRFRNTKVKRVVNSWLPKLALFTVGYILGAASIFSPVRELHNVEVLHVDAPRVYTLFIPAQQGHPKDEVQTDRLCIEGDDLPLKAGMVIEPFQYIQRVDCLLINRNTYVDWKRDAQRNVVDKNGKILFASEKEKVKEN